MAYLISIVAVIALLPVLLFLFVALFAWRVPPRAPVGRRDRRMIVIVPAHDEESVIEGILSDLSLQDYPSELLAVHVVADRCVDATAEIAGPFASVHQRTDGQPTKGAAVGWMIERLDIEDDDVVVIFDADARIGPGLVGALCDGADDGNAAMQAYLSTSNPDESYVALAGALSQWMSNRLIDLPRRNLGMSVSLLGTGFALVGDRALALASVGQGLTEDQALSDHFAIEGVRVVWLHHSKVFDEKPSSVEVLARQRARWAQGKSQGRRAALFSLAGSGGVWSMSRIDRIVRLILPGRSISAAVLAVIAVCASIWPSILLFSPVVIYVALGAVLLASVLALVVEGAGFSRIIRIPLIGLFALLWIPERIIARRGATWYHTPHGGAGNGEAEHEGVGNG